MNDLNQFVFLTIWIVLLSINFQVNSAIDNELIHYHRKPSRLSIRFHPDITCSVVALLFCSTTLHTFSWLVKPLCWCGLVDLSLKLAKSVVGHCSRVCCRVGHFWKKEAKLWTTCNGLYRYTHNNWVCRYLPSQKRS